MSEVFKDNGTWKKDPSGLTKGNLKAWRDSMFATCPNPVKGDIVVLLNEKSNKRYGYQCVEPDGYDTRWARVSQELYSEGDSYGYIEGVYTPINAATRPLITETASGIPCSSEGVYLGDGVYINPEDCWF